MFGVDVSLPPGWERVPTAGFDAAFVGPAEDGRRPVLLVSHEEIDPPIADAVETLVARQAQASPGYERLDERTLEIAGRWAYIEHHRWRGDGVALTQVLAVVLVEPGRVLKLDGACLTAREAEHLPQLDEIITSIEMARAAA